MKGIKPILEQREIEFKGYSKETDYVFEFDMWIPWEDEDDKGNTWYTKKMKIVQFVGLWDKEYQQIYEGDIIEVHSGIKGGIVKTYTIVFKDGAFMKTPEKDIYFNLDCLDLHKSVLHLTKVVGNIHQHSETKDK